MKTIRYASLNISTHCLARFQHNEAPNIDGLKRRSGNWAKQNLDFYPEMDGR